MVESVTEYIKKTIEEKEFEGVKKLLKEVRDTNKS